MPGNVAYSCDRNVYPYFFLQILISRPTGVVEVIYFGLFILIVHNRFIKELLDLAIFFEARLKYEKRCLHQSAVRRHFATSKMIHFEADFKEREIEPLAWLFGMPVQIVFNILSFSEKERYYVTFCNSILRTTKPYPRCTICTTSRDKKPNTSHLAVCSYVSQFYSLFYILVPFVWGPYKSWNLAELWYQLYVMYLQQNTSIYANVVRNGFSGHCYESGLIHTISSKTPQPLYDFQDKLTLILTIGQN